MKNAFSILAGFFLFAAVAQVHAQFNYTVNDGTITITGCTAYTGPDRSVIIPDEINNIPVTAIGENAFYNFSETSVIIPDSVTTIGDGAFSGCTALTNISIPDSVINIGFGAFSDCSALTNIAISSDVTNIGPAAFATCLSVMAYSVDPSNTAYCSVDGVLFDKLQTTLIQYPCDVAGSYTVPNTVTSIGYAAFGYNTRLTSVTIPSSVTNIGHFNFVLCYGLASVYFEGNAPIIVGTAFAGDTATSYYLPGTTGWSTNFGFTPTAVWTLPNPQVLSGTAGVQSNQFGFTVSWATNRSVVVEACTDMTNPDWEPVQTNTLTATPHGGWFPFSDPQWTNYPSRFYRIAAQ